jgi:hypothetical protein
VGEAGSLAGSAGTDSADGALIDDPDSGADATLPAEVGTDAAPIPDGAPIKDASVVDASTSDGSTIGPDITATGTIIRLILAPTGGGNHNPETIRDGDFPPVGSTDSARQYDTFTGDTTRAEDWIGYSFATSTRFVRVVFQDGKHFVDGGWFVGLKLQVRQGVVWVDVPGVVVSPAYAGMTSPTFTTYRFDFPPISGDAIRIDGVPGGSNKFISVGELRVYQAAP